MRVIFLIILFFASNAWAADTVLCGDDDNNGVVDILKQVGAVDRDCDGVASVADGGTDCNDLVPGQLDNSYTTTGCSAGQYRQCVAGTYGACTSANIAEKTHNYYISATGSGTTCSYASPCLPSVVSSGGAVTIVAPAAVYTVGSTDFSGSMIFFTTVSGTSNSVRNLFAKDPLSTAKWNTNAGCAAPCSTIKIQANNWDVRDSEVTGGDSTSSGGIRAEGSNITVKTNYVHDTAGANDNNLAGIYLGEGYSNIVIQNDIVNNTYDPTRTLSGSVRQNVFDIGALVGDGYIIDHNSIGYSHAVNTAPFEKQGGGARVKHGLAGASITTPTEIKNNIFYNTEYAASEVSSAKTWVHGNLEKGVSKALQITLNGGVLDINSIKFYNNTVQSGNHTVLGITDIDGAVSMLANGDVPTSGVVGGFSSTGNIIDDSAEGTYGGGNLCHLFRIAPYGADADFTRVITGGWLTFNNNCYYNSAVGAALTNGFGVYEDSGAPLGSSVNFANWKATYGYDSAAVVGNPTFDASFRSTANCLASTGWAAEWPTGGSTPANTLVLPVVFPK